MTRPAVLVTGGARRLGAAIVRRFADEGWHCVIHCNRSRADAEDLAATLPSAEVVQCDLIDSEAAIAMIDGLAARLPDWRVLVNSASIFVPDEATGLDPETSRLSMRINAVSPVRMSQAFLAHARSSSGRCVIDITDQKLANPNPDFFSYTMSKHALAATVPMLAMAASRADDRIYALAPGAILPSHDQSTQEADRSHVMNLLRRRTLPEEVADAAFFMARGRLTSGATLYVDSGQHLLSQPRDVLYLAREERI